MSQQEFGQKRTAVTGPARLADGIMAGGVVAAGVGAFLLLRSPAPRDPFAERAAQLLERVLTTPGAVWPERADAKSTAAQIKRRRAAALQGVAAADGGWVARQAAAIEKVSRGRWEAVVSALEGADRMEMIPVAVLALLQDCVLRPAELRSWVDKLPRHLGPRPWVLSIRSILEDCAREGQA